MNSSCFTVSPWRKFLTVNKFNRLQTTKEFESETILLLFLVLAEGYGYKYFSLMEASLTLKKSDSPENFVLNFFVITCIVYGLGIVKKII